MARVSLNALEGGLNRGSWAFEHLPEAAGAEQQRARHASPTVVAPRRVDDAGERPLPLVPFPAHEVPAGVDEAAEVGHRSGSEVGEQEKVVILSA